MTLRRDRQHQTADDYLFALLQVILCIFSAADQAARASSTQTPVSTVKLTRIVCITVSASLPASAQQIQQRVRFAVGLLTHLFPPHKF